MRLEIRGCPSVTQVVTQVLPKLDMISEPNKEPLLGVMRLLCLHNGFNPCQTEGYVKFATFGASLTHI